MLWHVAMGVLYQLDKVHGCGFQENVRSKSVPGEVGTTGTVHSDMLADNNKVITKDKEREREEDPELEKEEKDQEVDQKEQGETVEEEKEQEVVEEKEQQMEEEGEKEKDAEFDVVPKQPKDSKEDAELDTNHGKDGIPEPKTSTSSEVTGDSSSRSQAQTDMSPDEEPHHPISTGCIRGDEPADLATAQQFSGADRRSSGGRKGAKKQRPPKRIRDKLKKNGSTPGPGTTEEPLEEERRADMRGSEGARADGQGAHLWLQCAAEQLPVRGK